MRSLGPCQGPDRAKRSRQGWHLGPLEGVLPHITVLIAAAGEDRVKRTVRAWTGRSLQTTKCYQCCLDNGSSQSAMLVAPTGGLADVAMPQHAMYVMGSSCVATHAASRGGLADVAMTENIYLYYGNSCIARHAASRGSLADVAMTQHALNVTEHLHIAMLALLEEMPLARKILDSQDMSNRWLCLCLSDIAARRPASALIESLPV